METFLSAYGRFHVPLVYTICVSGICGHAVVLFSSARCRKLISPVNVMLLSLSLCHLLLLGGYLFFSTNRLLAESECDTGLWSYGWVLSLLISNNINIYTHTCAVMHVVSLSVIRYLGVTLFARLVSPALFSWKYICTVLTGVYFSALLICTPAFLSTKIVEGSKRFWCEANVTNLSVYHLELGEQSQKINFWFYAIGCKLLPSVLVFVITLLLVSRLKRFARRASTVRSGNNSHRDFIQTTHLILMVMILFVVVEVPQAMLNLWVGFVGPQAVPLYSRLTDFFEMLVLLYCSVNFSLYCIMSAQFREALKKSIVCFSYQTAKNHPEDTAFVQKTPDNVLLEVTDRKKSVETMAPLAAVQEDQL